MKKKKLAKTRKKKTTNYQKLSFIDNKSNRDSKSKLLCMQINEVNSQLSLHAVKKESSLFARMKPSTQLVLALHGNVRSSWYHYTHPVTFAFAQVDLQSYWVDV